MPATYAHYRFGAAMLNRMPADMGRTAKRNRRLFDVGLHGPDLFFFYRPVAGTKISKQGYKFHRQTGREFFGRVCRNLRLEPSEEAKAYLYGVLCHYALDSHCHPMVEAFSREGIASHSRIEAEFDRFLLDMDGKNPPFGMRLTKHMTLTEPETGVVSRFYPGVESRHVKESLRSMVKIRKMLELPDGPVRSAVLKTVSAGSETFRDMIVNPQPDEACRMLNGPLFEKYAQAEKSFPGMLLQLGAHLAYNAPLGAAFDPIFG